MTGSPKSKPPRVLRRLVSLGLLAANSAFEAELVPERHAPITSRKRGSTTTTNGPRQTGVRRR
jgi:hypothetical protein